MDWNEEAEKLVELAFVDESEPYEVDQAGIFHDAATGDFVLLTASGCSCWGGECDAERFASLDALAASLVTADRRYNPTLGGARTLVDEARAAWDRLCVG